MSDARRQQAGPNWLTPIVVLSGIALAAFVGLYALDSVFTGGPPIGNDRNAVERFLDFDPQAIGNALPQLAAMIAAVFGIVITVVSIIVQLSADRYTGVAGMFLRDRVNTLVFGFYLVVCVAGMWISFALQTMFIPRAAIVGILIATTIGLVLMAPYFGYVFWFLAPQNIITRIRKNAVDTARKGSKLSIADDVSDAQSETLTAMEELTDITSNSISGKDKIIASGAVDALKDFCVAYLDLKKDASGAWFDIGAALKQNPDFVAMDPESVEDLQTRRTWVEWKVMRQFLGIYNEALGGMRDINYLVAIDTRYIGEAASKMKDDELMQLVYRFLNSYLRATLNAKDVRTAYNVMNQYRLLVEALITDGNAKAALEGVKHMSYYGHVSFDMKLAFVTETVAWDISSICQHAHEHKSDEEEAMLAQFLDLDRPLRTQQQESALLGIRKAQVKLAAYYLAHGEESKARRIAEDMRAEPHARLAQIRESLEKVTTKDFWEIIDRGRNFEYMPPDQREKLAVFFEWLGITPRLGP
jgi:hypothetical protein